MAKIYGARWELLRSFDQGGQAQLFHVRDLRGTGEHVLKRILNPKRRDRFLREVEACKTLSHPNIMAIIDHSALDQNPADDTMYLVMPFAAGGNLEKRVALYKESTDSCIQVALGLAGALDHVHGRGVVHRDVKPANLLFMAQDQHCILSDFGICLIRESNRVTDTGEVTGPRAFMAPELEDGGQLDVTNAADLYSLGKVIYYLFSGGIILPRERIREKQYDMFTGRGLRRELLGRLLDRLICPLEVRVQSASEVMAELTRIRDWDQVNVGVLSTGTVSALEKLLQQQRTALSVEDHNKLIRERQSALLSSFKTGLLQWLDPELRGIASALSHAAISVCRFVDTATCDALGVLDNGINPQDRDRSFLSREFGVGICLEPLQDPFKRKYLLLFQLFTVRHSHVRLGRSPRPLADTDVGLAFVPYFVESEHMQGFVKVENGHVKGMGKMWDHHVLVYGSTVSAWPSVLPEYKKTLDTAVQALVEYVEHWERTGSSHMV